MFLVWWASTIKEETMKCLKSLILIASCLSSFALYPQEEGRRQTVIDGIAVSHGLVLDAIEEYLWEDRGIAKPVSVNSIKPVFFGSGRFDWQRLEVLVRAVQSSSYYMVYSCRVDVGGVAGGRAEGFSVVGCERFYGFDPSLWN